MIDHDAILSSGRLPRQAAPPLPCGPSPTAAPRASPSGGACWPCLASRPASLRGNRPFRLGRGTHYEILGVGRDADEMELKRAFHRLSRKWHPDKNPDHVAEAETVFKAVKFSYDVLADPAKRRRYDTKAFGTRTKQ